LAGLAHVTPFSRSKSQRSRSPGRFGCTGRPTWTYSNGDIFICVHEVIIVSPLAGLGGVMPWQTSTYSLLLNTVLTGMTLNVNRNPSPTII